MRTARPGTATEIAAMAAMTAAGVDMGTAMTAVPVRTAATAPSGRIPESGGSSPITSTISI